MKTKILTEQAPQPGVMPFSQAIAADKLVFTAGQIYLTAEGKLLEGTIKEQIHQVMNNLQAILVEAGVTFAEVAKTKFMGVI